MKDEILCNVKRKDREGEGEEGERECGWWGGERNLQLLAKTLCPVNSNNSSHLERSFSLEKGEAPFQSPLDTRPPTHTPTHPTVKWL